MNFTMNKFRKYKILYTRETRISNIKIDFEDNHRNTGVNINKVYHKFNLNNIRMLENLTGSMEETLL